jgi:hypothetical protein
MAHELSHYLLDHQVERVFKFGRHRFISPYFNRDKGNADPVVVDFKKMMVMQWYSCFYPQQRAANKFTERHCDQLAMHLFKKTFPDIEPADTVISLYGS